MKPRQRTKPRKTKRKKSLSKEKDCPGEIQIEKPKLEKELGIPKLNAVPVKTEYQILGITDNIRNQIKIGINIDKHRLEKNFGYHYSEYDKAKFVFDFVVRQNCIEQYKSGPKEPYSNFQICNAIENNQTIKLNCVEYSRF
ncbi:MAG: hypothetical protein ACPL06_00005, partial [Candidatus Anstonellales archaeon]